MPWFALVPLLASLYRHRHRARERWVHGVVFGWVLSPWLLHPLAAGDLLDARSDGSLDLAEAAGTLAAHAGAWTGMALSWALFAAASGFLLRRRFALANLAGLPALWAGIEYLRLEVLPEPMGWLALGTFLRPGSPETQLAAAGGTLGLSLALVASNTAFFLVLLEKRRLAQFLLAGIGSGIAVLCFVEGLETREDPAPVSAVRIGVVQIEATRLEQPLTLARRIVSSNPDLILLPEAAFLAGHGELARLEAALGGFAREEDVALVAGVGMLPAAPETAPGEPLAGGLAEDALAAAPPAARRPLAPSRILVYADPKLERVLEITGTGEPRARGADGSETAALLDTDLGRIGIASGSCFDGPVIARRLAAGGAQVFLLAGLEPADSGRAYARLRARQHAFRALECGIWLARATLGGYSAIIDGRGAPANEAPPGAAWAAVSPVALKPPERAPSAFVRWGWRLGPVCLGVAAGLLVAATFAPLARRTR